MSDLSNEVNMGTHTDSFVKRTESNRKIEEEHFGANGLDKMRYKRYREEGGEHCSGPLGYIIAIRRVGDLIEAEIGCSSKRVDARAFQE
jgi:hypothetical protein